MKNKIKLKKYLISSLITIIIFIIFYSVLELKKYNSYTNNFNSKINLVLLKVNSEYPNVTRKELIEILNSDINDNNFLAYYGIDIEKESIILENDRDFNNFLILDLSLLIIFSLALIFLFLKYNNNKDKEIKEITKYIEQINHKNYKLNIDEISEDELSILKNEIYKTTIMLKEQAENSIKDKINLKDSLSDISHQLKTPLTSILVILDNLIDNPNMEINVREDFIRDIKRQISNINFLVQSILKLSMFEANTINFIKENVLLKNIIDESIKNVSALCDLKNINIKVESNYEYKIICDFKWQVEAITNILKNCVEHSPCNSNIIINYEQNKIYSLISIKDFGNGIDKKDLPHIFERFYKGKNISKESIGIGLSLSKAIIEENNGRITVESNSKGTIFKIKYFE